MLSAWALKNWRLVAAGLAILALLAVMAVGFWQGLAEIAAMQTRAAEAARDERDAHWTAEIAKANAAVHQARAEQAVAVGRIEAQAGEQAGRFQTELNELEKANAALAGGDRCGLGRDRVRLLNEAR
ncbi:MAG: hypothetical protein DI527_07625 [Chelatococcus sp.]|nr:MAG: hypothetical protein DI527_07625 [Chelatococcus sp.]